MWGISALCVLLLCKVGFWGPIFVSNYAHMPDVIVSEWMVWIGVWIGHGCWCWVCETMSESAILAQASQARLGEICRDSYSIFCSNISLRRGNLDLGDRPSCLGECVSRKRELVCVYWVVWLHISCRQDLLFWVKVRLAQARAFHLSESSRNDVVHCGVRRLGEVP